MELGGKDIEMNNTNNMKTINYKPGQILYSKSTDCWVYISVLRYTKPHNASGTMELHTCCDLCIDGDDGSKTITFARGDGTLLDVDTTFEEVREATSEERLLLSDVLVKTFKDYDLSWTNHFTDSTYDDIRDWLCWDFNVDLDNMDNNDPFGVTIYEITNYIWDVLCKETGNYQEKTVEPEMVNKQEFIDMACKWIENNIFDFPWYDSDGEFSSKDVADALRKYLEE